jgi:hypothetical protein
LESAGFDRCAISSFANRAFGTVLVMTKMPDLELRQNQLAQPHPLQAFELA